MADEHHRAGVVGERAEDLLAAGRVEVVRGLVEQQHVRRGDHEHGERQPGLLAAGQHAGRLVAVVAGEQERAEHAAGLGGGEVRRGRHHVLEHGALDVDGLVLLRVVADAQAVPGLELPGVRLVHAREDPQQGRLARAVQPEDHDLRAAVDREVDGGEDLERAVRLRQVRRHERRLAGGGGVREPQLRDALDLADLLQARQQALGPADHVLRGDRLRRLRTHLGRLQLQHARLLLGVLPLALAPLLVALALLQVLLPAHVVDVEHLAVRVEVEDAVHDLADEVDVVADHDHAALVLLEEVAQPDHGVGVEVVRRLVQDQRAGVREQDAGQLDAAPLAARQGPEGLVQDAVRQGEVRGDRCGLRLRRVPAAREELLLQGRVAVDRLLGDRGVGGAHALRGLGHLQRDGAEPAGVEDAGARELVGVAGPRVLRQVADLAPPLDLAVGGHEVAREHLGEGGLAGAVAADEADLVAVGDAELDVRHQSAGADGDLEAVHGEHDGLLA